MAQTAIQQRNETPRSGKSRNPEEVSHVLASLRQDCNVIAPPGLDGVRLPNGFSVVWSNVDIDSRHVFDGGDAYNVQGGWTLSATAIDRLASAFGITWDAQRSGRLDAGQHPHLCQYLAVGSYMGPDGMPIAVSGTNMTDLRDGSAQTDGIRNKDGTPNLKMLRQQRQHILSISESKARARAFRKEVGLRAKPQTELARPWVVFRVQLTGETDDPGTQKMFEAMIFQNALGARAALYGPPTALPSSHGVQAPQLAHVQPVPQLIEHDDDGEVIDDDYDTPAPYVPPKANPPAQETQRQSPPPQRGSAPRQSSGATWPWNAKKDGDPEKGTPLADVDDRSLERLAKYYEDKPGDERYRDRNLALAAEARAIVASRNEPVGDGFDDCDPSNPDDF